jgi:hypothetical protein
MDGASARWLGSSQPMIGPTVMAELENAAVVHNPSKQRFEIDAEGRNSVLEYRGP